MESITPPTDLHEYHIFIPYKVMVNIINYLQKHFTTTICDEGQEIFLKALLGYYNNPNMKIWNSTGHEIKRIDDIPMLKDDLNKYGFLSVSIQLNNLEHSFVLVNTEKGVYIVDSYVLVRCVGYRSFNFDKLSNINSLEAWNELFLSNEKRLRNERDVFVIYYGYYYPLTYNIKNNIINPNYNEFLDILKLTEY